MSRGMKPTFTGNGEVRLVQRVCRRRDIAIVFLEALGFRRLLVFRCEMSAAATVADARMVFASAGMMFSIRSCLNSVLMHSGAVSNHRGLSAVMLLQRSPHLRFADVCTCTHQFSVLCCRFWLCLDAPFTRKVKARARNSANARIALFALFAEKLRIEGENAKLSECYSGFNGNSDDFLRGA